MEAVEDGVKLLDKYRRALAASEARFQNIIGKNAEGVVVLSRDGLIRYVNPAAEALLGRPGVDMVGSPLDIPFKLGKTSEVDIRRQDGNGRIAEIRSVDTEWDGAPARLVLLRDITEHKLLEGSLRQRARELAEDDRRKDEFLAILSHELRNPLAAVLSALGVMSSCRSEDLKLERAREAVDRQVRHMARLLDDLLDISRITHGKVELRKEPLELSVLVGEAVQASRSLISERRHRLIIALPPEPLWVQADPTRLAQVVDNLLSNAAKYTEPGGRIWLSADREDGEAVLRVRDSGIGIPPHMLQRIFDLFTQLDFTYDRTHSGLGIGLTLVRRLVEQHGGRVEAHSDGEGRGSEFVIRLPIHVVEEPGSGEMPALPAFTPPPFIPIRRRIVLVEDMADAREMLKELLEMVGHDVHTAGDGLSGLELIRTVKPDLGLIDVGLPRLDGHEVARRLRSEPGKQASLYLVAMTGYSQPRDRQLALEAGFNDHLVKPVQLEDLMRAIDRAGALTGKSN